MGRGMRAGLAPASRVARKTLGPRIVIEHPDETGLPTLSRQPLCKYGSYAERKAITLHKYLH